MPLYGGDWFKDVQLRKCKASTRGIWIDCLLLMWEDDRCGKLEGTPEQLASALGCQVPDFKAAAADLYQTNAADVTLRHGVVTLINRRQRREYIKRKGAARRQQRKRQRELFGLGNKPDIETAEDGVTPESRPDLSSSVSYTPEREADRIEAYRGNFGANRVARQRGRGGGSEVDRAGDDLLAWLESQDCADAEPESARGDLEVDD